MFSPTTKPQLRSDNSFHHDLQLENWAVALAGEKWLLVKNTNNGMDGMETPR
ncbi:hypothetical protein [Pontibacter saemangeumensis]|uniref:hypothetical protein n=1 Tax=Pontibacter saemangeumensis TaxID=1084525 RepID=UPI0031EB83A4